MPRLSAIIIALNEAGNIADCLDTLSFCDERIVVDGGSTDATAQIAQGKGARVMSHPFEGFGAQKGFALSLATGDWVLSIDADERVSAALAQEIRNAIAAGLADAYELPRRSSFCGRLMDHSGWAPDYVLRLFRRDKAYFSADLVHERVVCNGTDGAVERAADARSRAPARGCAVAHGPLFDRRRRTASGRRAERLVHVGDFSRAVDVPAHLCAARGLPRRPRGVSARRRQRRGHLLPLHEGLAEGAPSR